MVTNGDDLFARRKGNSNVRTERFPFVDTIADAKFGDSWKIDSLRSGKGGNAL